MENYNKDDINEEERNHSTPFLTQSEKSQIATEVKLAEAIAKGKYQYQFQDLNNKLDNLKASLEDVKINIKELSNNAKARELLDIDNRTKIASIDIKLTYFQSEFLKIEPRLENLTETRSDYKRDISLLTEKIQALDKEVARKVQAVENEIDEIKEKKKELTVNTIAIMAIVASIVSAIITGIIDKFLR